MKGKKIRFYTFNGIFTNDADGALFFNNRSLRKEHYAKFDVYVNLLYGVNSKFPRQLAVVLATEQDFELEKYGICHKRRGLIKCISMNTFKEIKSYEKLLEIFMKC